MTALAATNARVRAALTGGDSPRRAVTGAGPRRRPGPGVREEILARGPGARGTFGRPRLGRGAMVAALLAVLCMTVPLAVSADATVQLLFTYGSEKQPWIEDVTEAFNAGDFKTKCRKAHPGERRAQWARARP